MPKKSITPFTYYTFRFDYADDNQLEKIKKYIIRDFPKYAMFIEISTEVKKQHIQGKIGRALSLEQTRKLLIKEFPNTFTRSNYSMSLIDKPEEYDSYICKDGKVLCNNVFEPDYIQAQVDKHKELVVAFKKKKEKTQNITFTQKIFNDFQIDNPLDVRDIIYRKEYNPTDEDIKCYDKACQTLLTYILKRLGKAVKCFDTNILQRMYNAIKNSILTLNPNYELNVFKDYKNLIQL